MANYRYQVLLDEETNEIIKAVPAYKRSEFFRQVIKDHKIRQVERESEKKAIAKAKNVRFIQ